MLHKFGKWNWRDFYRLPSALLLGFLVLRNYSMRQRALMPDEWYWADEKMLSWGYAFSSNEKKNQGLEPNGESPAGLEGST